MPSVNLNSSKNVLFKNLSKNLKAVAESPHEFLRKQEKTNKKIKTLLHQTYNFTYSKDANKDNPELLPELVDNLDAEQIWQLLELRNNVVWPLFLAKAATLLSLKNDDLQIKFKSEIEEEEQIKSYDSDENGGESDHENSIKEVKKRKTKSKGKQKSSIVDDDFFKLSEMEEFLKAEDKKELNKDKVQQSNDDFNINLFDEKAFEDEEEENIHYRDFFNDDDEDESHMESDNDKSENSEDESVDNESENNSQDDDKVDIPEEDEYQNGHDNEMKTDTILDATEDKMKSSFEDRNERLKQRIKDYEQEMLGENPWQLKGEIDATNRPQNSLLEEILEFEATSRPAPIITEETTLRLEDIIRQRIKDQVWDDVEFKVKPTETVKEYRQQIVLDQEKSKESLARIYEKQYQAEMEKLDPNSADGKEEEEPKSHKEIKEMMEALFVKLDALTNFNFIPQPAPPEPKIITNTPAIIMEEVAPVAVSSAQLLAPQEVLKPSKSVILGKNERGKTDKNRERRQKKLKQKAIYKAKEAKTLQKQKLGIKLTKKEETDNITKQLTKRRNVEKISNSREANANKSSKAFFSKLQETTVMQKKNRKNDNSDKKSLSAKKFKL